MTWCILHTWAGGGEGVNCPSTDCIQHSYGGCMLHDGRLDQKTNSSLIILINIIFRIQQLTFHTTQFRVLGFIMDLNIRVQLCASNNQTRKVGWVSNNLVFRGNLIAFVLKVFSAAPGYNCSSATASCMRTFAPASAAPAQIIQTKIGGITICLGARHQQPAWSIMGRHFLLQFSTRRCHYRGNK